MNEHDFSEAMIADAMQRVAKNTSLPALAWSSVHALAARARGDANWQTIDARILELRRQVKPLPPHLQLLVLESAKPEFEKMANDEEARKQIDRSKPRQVTLIQCDQEASGRAAKARHVCAGLKLLRTRLQAGEEAACSAQDEASFRATLQDLGDSIRAFASTLALEARESIIRSSDDAQPNQQIAA